MKVIALLPLAAGLVEAAYLVPRASKCPYCFGRGLQLMHDL
jgi:hypothetical protein